MICLITCDLECDTTTSCDAYTCGTENLPAISFHLAAQIGNLLVMGIAMFFRLQISDIFKIACPFVTLIV